MYRVIVLLVLLLSGCATTGQSDSEAIISENREQMFIEADNLEKLIEFYKQELKLKESAETRLKLAKTYLDANDPESSIFVIEQLTASQHGFDAELILTKANFQLGHIEQASHHSKLALGYDSQSGESHNLAGIIAVVEGELGKAEIHFIEARKQFYNDDVVKNNLATLYLVQGRVAESYDLLQSVYANNPNDSKTKANLVIAMVRLGHEVQAQALLRQDYSKKQAHMIVTALAQSDALDGSPMNFEE